MNEDDFIDKNIFAVRVAEIHSEVEAFEKKLKIKNRLFGEKPIKEISMLHYMDKDISTFKMDKNDVFDYARCVVKDPENSRDIIAVKRRCAQKVKDSLEKPLWWCPEHTMEDIKNMNRKNSNIDFDKCLFEHPRRLREGSDDEAWVADCKLDVSGEKAYIDFVKFVESRDKSVSNFQFFGQWDGIDVFSTRDDKMIVPYMWDGFVIHSGEYDEVPAGEEIKEKLRALDGKLALDCKNADKIYSVIDEDKNGILSSNTFVANDLNGREYIKNAYKNEPVIIIQYKKR